MDGGKVANVSRRVALGVLPVLVATVAGRSVAEDGAARLDALLDRIEARLAVMPDVARHKHNTGAPVEDLPREAQVIAAAVARAEEAGIDRAFARAFFQAQIDASKMMQTARLAAWKAANQPVFRDVPDLATVIRPALDALTPALIAALKDALPHLPAGGSRLEARARAYGDAHPGDGPAFRRAIEPLKPARPGTGE